MTDLWMRFVGMSASASILILVVLIVRRMWKNMPKWVVCWLWILVGLRLLCPVALESPFSLVPQSIGSGEIMETWTDVYMEEVTTLREDSDRYWEAVAEGQAPIHGEDGSYYVLMDQELQDAPQTLQEILLPVLTRAWIAGMAVMVFYYAVRHFCLKRRLATAVRLRDNLYQSEAVDSPFVLGWRQPKIYLPFGVEEKTMGHVIAHEQAHIQRHDPQKKALGLVAVVLHWWNPLVWLAYGLWCRDIEMACDEQVVRSWDRESRAGYAEALLGCSVSRPSVKAWQLAFGELDIKRRVAHVLQYKKPAAKKVLAAFLVCVVMAGLFLTSSHGLTVEDIRDGNGCFIWGEQEAQMTLHIPVSALPDSIYEKGGHQFEENEVIVYQTDTTKIYLQHVMPANEGDDQLYFTFKFSYELPPEGSILTVVHGTENRSFTTHVGPRTDVLTDDVTSYEEAVYMRGSGHDHFVFYVDTEACKAAVGTIRLEAFCWEITYEKQSPWS